ncbi:MAG TPA: Flp family type IVb pilin [Actinomycetota bacterium]|nr:Flp family type IVb pilin [Actinomycetota bacterium]
MVAMHLWLQYKIAELLNKEEGAAAVEYGLLVGLIAVAIIAAVALLGTKLDELFDFVNTELADVPAAT